MDKLPEEIQSHVDAYITATDWGKVADQLGDPCQDCPGQGWAITHPDDRHSPPCFACPLWALKCDLTLLHLRARLDKGGINTPG